MVPNALLSMVLATRMPGVAEVVVLLLIVSLIVGLPVAGLTVLIVGLVARTQGRPKSATYLWALGSIVLGAFPAAVLLFVFIVAVIL